MKSVVQSVGVIVFVGMVVAGGTVAFFSDTETSTGNMFTAGSIDLTVDSEAHYNGSICTLVEGEETETTVDDLYEWVGGDEYPVGLPCTGTWEATDLGAHTFFNYTDIKPGDEGENTISLHITSNPAWACVDVSLVANDDMSSTEPELEVPGEVLEDAGQDFDGELAQNMKFAAWLDQGNVAGWQGGVDLGEGDNIWQGEPAEPLLFSNDSGPASDVLGGKTYALADSTTGFGPMAPNVTNYIGLAWCAGTQTVSGNTISCNGSTLGNIVQTDSMVADIAFRVEQARNNEDFVCDEEGGGDDDDNGGGDDDDDGGGLGCTEKGDVMFVLDSSGSIDAVELLQLKNSAISFADALNPLAEGNHIGVVDFDSNATLRSHLTEVELDIENAINLLTSGGQTNLGAGITTASIELANPGDGHDRLDAEAPDYMVILTDGDPQDPVAATAAADAAKAAGTTIYVVGIGGVVNDEYLESIASSPSLYFSSDEFDDLEAILDDIAECNVNDAP